MAKSQPSFPKGMKVVTGPSSVKGATKVTNNATTISDAPTTKKG